jgi:hypothetical protein
MSDLRRLTEEAAAKNAAFNESQRARVAEAKIAAAGTSKETVLHGETLEAAHDGGADAGRDVGARAA